MSLLDGKFAFGFALGFGTGFVTRDLLRDPRGTAAPVVRAFVRGGIRVVERTREWSAEFGELLQDTFAEVQESLKAHRHGHAPPPKKRPRSTRRRRTHRTVDNVVVLEREARK